MIIFLLSLFALPVWAESPGLLERVDQENQSVPADIKSRTISTAPLFYQSDVELTAEDIEKIFEGEDVIKPKITFRQYFDFLDQAKLATKTAKELYAQELQTCIDAGMLTKHANEIPSDAGPSNGGFRTNDPYPIVKQDKSKQTKPFKIGENEDVNTIASQQNHSLMGDQSKSTCVPKPGHFRGPLECRNPNWSNVPPEASNCAPLKTAVAQADWWLLPILYQKATAKVAISPNPEPDKHTKKVVTNHDKSLETTREKDQPMFEQNCSDGSFYCKINKLGSLVQELNTFSLAAQQEPNSVLGCHTTSPKAEETFRSRTQINTNPSITDQPLKGGNADDYQATVSEEFMGPIDQILQSPSCGNLAAKETGGSIGSTNVTEQCRAQQKSAHQKSLQQLDQDIQRQMMNQTMAAEQDTMKQQIAQEEIMLRSFNEFRDAFREIIEDNPDQSQPECE